MGEYVLITIVLSFFALFISLMIKYWSGISAIEVCALFFGLEGTVLLASALSPPRHDIESPKKNGILNWLKWWRDEGRGYAYPIQYNPVFFYAGLIFLAISMTLSAISR